MPAQNVHLRINDPAHGKPTPVRLRVTDAAGQEFAPFGRTVLFPHGRGEDVGGKLRVGHESWFTIDGACEIALPPGELRVQARKGPGYVPLDERVTLIAGKMALRFTLDRRFDHRTLGWLAIDTRQHFAPPHAALLDARADDLDVANLLIEPLGYLGRDGNSYITTPNLEAYSGQLPAIAHDETRVDVNTHNRHPVLGSLALLNTHRVVYPLSFGGADAPDDWSLTDWAQQGHRKGGLVVWTGAFGKAPPHGSEALALAITGEVDALEFTADNWQQAMRGWYHLLNSGVNRPVVGASGRDANSGTLTPLRTMVKLIDDSWVAGVRAGATVVTTGPLLELKVDARRATAIAIAIGLDTPARLDIIANGVPLATTDGPELVADAPSDCWLAARLIGPGGTFAHTSAVVVGTPPRDPAAAGLLLNHLHAGQAWVETIGQFNQPKSRAHLLETFAAAQNRIQSVL